MKQILEFNLFEATRSFRESGENLPEWLLSELQQRWPQFFPHGPTGMIFVADENDSVFQEVVGFLRLHNREPYLKRRPSLVNVPELRASHYQVEGKRLFEFQDYEQAKFFRFNFMQWIAKSGRRKPDGLLQVSTEEVTDELIGGVGSWGAKGCAESLKIEMQTQKFVGLKFRPIEIVGKALTPLWEPWSDKVMPAVLNRLVNSDGADFDSTQHRCCVPDDFYQPYLLRFPAAKVHELGNFDVAVTQNQFGIPRDNTLIVSRRFRDWCEQRGLKILWYPVVLE